MDYNLIKMKNFFFALGIIVTLSIIGVVGCDKADNDNAPQMEARRGGNGNGRGSTTGTTTTTTSSSDSLLDACGVLRADTGWWYPTVQLNNLTWRKQTGYSYDPNTGTNSNAYDILVINFDAAVIPGKIVTGYQLRADQCSGRPVCTKSNGYYLSQVTTNNPTTQFWLPIGTTWLNPYTPSYTGVIMIATSDGCLFYSQFFSFEPPRIL
jgi:hypothetical protein